MARPILSAAVLLSLAAAASAVPVMPFTDTKTFAEKATDVLVAECLDPDPDPGPKIEVTTVSVDVVKVLKGDRKTGRAKLATIGQPMEKGRRYLMASFGGSVGDIKFLAQADLAVVEIPPTFDLKTLDGKTVAEQMQLVFDARREQVRVRLIELQREKEALEKTAPKPEVPKLAPPEVKFVGAEVRGGSTYMAFEVANPNADPVPYVGYKPDSFDPKLPDGQMSPLYKTEYRSKGGEWKDDPLGWCGTGRGPVSVAGQASGKFEAPLYKEGEWDEIRVGVLWYTGGHGKDPQTAWSQPVSRKDVRK